MRNVVLHTGVAALLLAAAGCEPEEGQPSERPPVAVETLEVEARPFVRTLEAMGALRSPESTEVAAEISGKVVFLDVPEGQPVDEGRVLARLNASTTQAELSVARARLQGAEQTLERTQALHAEQIASGQQLDEAQTAKKASRAEVARGAAQLDLTVIRAPFPGLVGLREVSRGAFLSAGTTITRLTRIKPLQLRFSVPERYVGQVREKQVVHGVVGSCEHRFTATVSVVDPYVDPVTRSFRVQAVVPNDDESLRPGMSARLRVELEEVPRAIVIPEQALVRQGTQERVYVVTKEQTIAAREVTVGEHRVGKVEIRKGLQPGEQVVTAGYQKVRAGAEVAPQPHEPIDNPHLKLGSPDEQARCWF